MPSNSNGQDKDKDNPDGEKHTKNENAAIPSSEGGMSPPSTEVDAADKTRSNLITANFSSDDARSGFVRNKVNTDPGKVQQYEVIIADGRKANLYDNTRLSQVAKTGIKFINDTTKFTPSHMSTLQPLTSLESFAGQSLPTTTSTGIGSMSLTPDFSTPMPSSTFGGNFASAGITYKAVPMNGAIDVNYDKRNPESLNLGEDVITNTIASAVVSVVSSQRDIEMEAPKVGGISGLRPTYKTLDAMTGSFQSELSPIAFFPSLIVPEIVTMNDENAYRYADLTKQMELWPNADISSAMTATQYYSTYFASIRLVPSNVLHKTTRYMYGSTFLSLQGISQNLLTDLFSYFETMRSRYPTSTMYLNFNNTSNPFQFSSALPVQNSTVPTPVLALNMDSQLEAGLRPFRSSFSAAGRQTREQGLLLSSKCSVMTDRFTSTFMNSQKRILDQVTMTPDDYISLITERTGASVYIDPKVVNTMKTSVLKADIDHSAYRQLNIILNTSEVQAAFSITSATIYGYAAFKDKALDMSQLSNALQGAGLTTQSYLIEMVLSSMLKEHAFPTSVDFNEFLVAKSLIDAVSLDLYAHVGYIFPSMYAPGSGQVEGIGHIAALYNLACLSMLMGRAYMYNLTFRNSIVVQIAITMAKHDPQANDFLQTNYLSPYQEAKMMERVLVPFLPNGISPFYRVINALDQFSLNTFQQSQMNFNFQHLAHRYDGITNGRVSYSFHAIEFQREERRVILNGGTMNAIHNVFNIILDNFARDRTGLRQPFFAATSQKTVVKQSIEELANILSRGLTCMLGVKYDATLHTIKAGMNPPLETDMNGLNANYVHWFTGAAGYRTYDPNTGALQGEAMLYSPVPRFSVSVPDLMPRFAMSDLSLGVTSEQPVALDGTELWPDIISGISMVLKYQPDTSMLSETARMVNAFLLASKTVATSGTLARYPLVMTHYNRSFTEPGKLSNLSQFAQMIYPKAGDLFPQSSGTSNNLRYVEIDLVPRHQSDPNLIAVGASYPRRRLPIDYSPFASVDSALTVVAADDPYFNSLYRLVQGIAFARVDVEFPELDVVQRTPAHIDLEFTEDHEIRFVNQPSGEAKVLEVSCQIGGVAGWIGAEELGTNRYYITAVDPTSLPLVIRNAIKDAVMARLSIFAVPDLMVIIKDQFIWSPDDDTYAGLAKDQMNIMETVLNKPLTQNAVTISRPILVRGTRDTRFFQSKATQFVHLLQPVPTEFDLAGSNTSTDPLAFASTNFEPLYPADPAQYGNGNLGGNGSPTNAAGTQQDQVQPVGLGSVIDVVNNGIVLDAATMRSGVICQISPIPGVPVVKFKST